jgi:hypothetical protein
VNSWYSSFISSGGFWNRTNSPDRNSPDGISFRCVGAGASHTAQFVARTLTGA